MLWGKAHWQCNGVVSIYDIFSGSHVCMHSPYNEHPYDCRHLKALSALIQDYLITLPWTLEKTLQHKLVTRIREGFQLFKLLIIYARPGTPLSLNYRESTAVPFWTFWCKMACRQLNSVKAVREHFYLDIRLCWTNKKPQKVQTEHVESDCILGWSTKYAPLVYSASILLAV